MDNAYFKRFAKRAGYEDADIDQYVSYEEMQPKKEQAPIMATGTQQPYEITQQFGQQSEYEPQSGGINYGTDIATPAGTPVKLPEGNWQVLEAQSGAGVGNLNDWTNQGYGNSVIVQNQDTGEYLRLSHLQDVGVEPGQTVQGGQVIATTGASGHVTGEHLDIERYDSTGTIADPLQQYSVEQLVGGPTPPPELTPYTPEQLVGTPQPTTPELDQNYYAEGTPDEYKPMIERASKETGIPTHVLSAQLKQESGFDPNISSPVGAQGIAQFMPATAERFGIDPLDPEQAIRAQGTYMKSNLDRFGGDTDKALAAYNAGEGAVEEYGGIPPYPETQGYVSNINKMAQEATASAKPRPQVAEAMLKTSKEKQKEIPFWKKLLGLQ